MEQTLWQQRRVEGADRRHLGSDLDYVYTYDTAGAPRRERGLVWREGGVWHWGAEVTGVRNATGRVPGHGESVAIVAAQRWIEGDRSIATVNEVVWDRSRDERLEVQ